MPISEPFYFGSSTITSGATAVSILALLQAASFQPTGSCVSLNVTCSTATYWGNASTVDNTSGAAVAANVPVTDSAVGALSDTIPIARIFVFNNSGSPCTATIYARFIP